MTRDRISTAVIIAVVAALGMWIAFHTYWDDVVETTPLQGEAARNAFYSVERVARALGMHTQKLASLHALPPTDGVLLVNDFHSDVSHTAVPLLEHWVESGGRLAVTWGSLWSTPALLTWGGLKTAPVVAHAGAVAAAPSGAAPDQDCLPMGVQVDGTDTGDKLILCGGRFGPGFLSRRIPRWALVAGSQLMLFRVPIGRGSLVVIGPAWLLTAKTFLRHDAAESFIAATALRRGERLTIYTAGNAEPLLSIVWRLAAPALVVFALTLLLLILRQLPRFGPPAPVPAAARRSLAEQIRANARFAWRTGTLDFLRMAVIRSVHRTAQWRIAGYGLLTQRQRAAELGRRTGVDPATLNSAMTDDAAGDPARQRVSIAVLERCRRGLHVPLRPRGNPHER